MQFKFIYLKVILILYFLGVNIFGTLYATVFVVIIMGKVLTNNHSEAKCQKWENYRSRRSCVPMAIPGSTWIWYGSPENFPSPVKQSGNCIVHVFSYINTSIWYCTIACGSVYIGLWTGKFNWCTLIFLHVLWDFLLVVSTHSDSQLVLQITVPSMAGQC